MMNGAGPERPHYPGSPQRYHNGMHISPVDSTKSTPVEYHHQAYSLSSPAHYIGHQSYYQQGSHRYPAKMSHHYGEAGHYDNYMDNRHLGMNPLGMQGVPGMPRTSTAFTSIDRPSQPIDMGRGAPAPGSSPWTQHGVPPYSMDTTQYNQQGYHDYSHSQQQNSSARFQSPPDNAFHHSAPGGYFSGMNTGFSNPAAMQQGVTPPTYPMYPVNQGPLNQPHPQRGAYQQHRFPIAQSSHPTPDPGYRHQTPYNHPNYTGEQLHGPRLYHSPGAARPPFQYGSVYNPNPAPVAPSDTSTPVTPPRDYTRHVPLQPSPNSGHAGFGYQTQPSSAPVLPVPSVPTDNINVPEPQPQPGFIQSPEQIPQVPPPAPPRVGPVLTETASNPFDDVKVHSNSSGESERPGNTTHHEAGLESEPPPPQVQHSPLEQKSLQSPPQDQVTTGVVSTPGSTCSNMSLSPVVSDSQKKFNIEQSNVVLSPVNDSTISSTQPSLSGQEFDDENSSSGKQLRSDLTSDPSDNSPSAILPSIGSDSPLRVPSPCKDLPCDMLVSDTMDSMPVIRPDIVLDDSQQSPDPQTVKKKRGRKRKEKPIVKPDSDLQEIDLNSVDLSKDAKVKNLRRNSPSKVPKAGLKKRGRKRKVPSFETDLDGGAIMANVDNVDAKTEDNSVEKRRSSRNKKRKTYVEDVDLSLSDYEGPADADQSQKFFQDNPKEEDSVIVEKILSHRKRVNEGEEEDVDEIEEYFVKYKNYSYLHCEWASMEQLRKDKRIQQKIKRFHMKQNELTAILTEQWEDDPFNPDYMEVERVLDVSVSEDNEGKAVTYYLVKWRSLPYDDSTWELEEDVDVQKIKQFQHLKQPPSEDIESKPRPPGDAWSKLTKTRTYNNDNRLRDYQLEGVNWLSFCWYNRQNCILADEMGLGKTIQSITFLNEVFAYGIEGPFLVIAPLSTIANWLREFETWTDINTVVYHGSAASRKMIQEYEMYYKDERGKRNPKSYKFHVVITTYEIVLADCQEMKSIPWRVVIIDEAHRLKNKNCKLIEGLKQLNMEHKVLLTGTPLQNNVEELFSLLNFLDAGRFPSRDNFLEEFGDLKTEEQVAKLQQLLKPMMLRRLKEDVEKNIAPKEETIIEVELTNIQKKYYRAILERNFSFLAKGAIKSTNVPQLMNTMMELRKCCNHPFLINGAEEQIMIDFHSDVDGFLSAMIQSAGKMVLIDKLLKKLKDGGHKVLIFSQMVRCLDIIEDYLLHRQYPFERIDGRVRGYMRQAAIDRFSKPDSDRFVFLLCTRAGGLGINLTAADTVIIFDSDWNPQNDIQAQARCHRIGQEKHVKVYRLITRNSYEREMFDKASLKLGLDKAVLQSMGNKDMNNSNQQLSKKEIEELLRRGAYGAVMDDDDEGNQFCEEDIDQILQRRTKVVTIQSEGKGSTFAKASFVASGNEVDIQIDDPNFWQKWAKKADINPETTKSKDDLLMDMPRQRTRTKRYGGEENLDDMLNLSDLDSDEEKTKKLPVCQAGWLRVDFFRTEKSLLTYGWGNWTRIMENGRFKRLLSEEDIEDISRVVLVYCLHHYHGDEKIKAFIWDLISPIPANSETHKNHSGVSNTLPRGRKSKRGQEDDVDTSRPSTPEPPDVNWATLESAEHLLTDKGYKKHLRQQCNKIVLRVRLLYYLKQEVIGEKAEQINNNAPAGEIDIVIPQADGENPSPDWDEQCDKSLLIGVFRHGYEMYHEMRLDPHLCFLSKFGPPEGITQPEETNNECDDMEPSQDNENDEVAVVTEELKICHRRTQPIADDNDEDTTPYSSTVSSPAQATDAQPSTAIDLNDVNDSLSKLFPGASELNTRLRRLITGYQRTHKKHQMKLQAIEKEKEKREKYKEAERIRKIRKMVKSQKWTRREENDFYRIVSTFGVQFDKESKTYDWAEFRRLARLDKKTDERLTEYYKEFRSMCKKVCRGSLDPSIRENTKEQPEDVDTRSGLIIEHISEDRARRCLQRIDLLNLIRNDVLKHAKLEGRLTQCQRSFDLPEWWIPGTHDRDLLLGAARYGVVRTDYHFLCDPSLSFYELRRTTSRLSRPVPTTQSSVVNSTTLSDTPIIKEEKLDEDSLPDSDMKSSFTSMENGGRLNIKKDPDDMDAADAQQYAMKSELEEDEQQVGMEGLQRSDDGSEVLLPGAQSVFRDAAILRWPKDRTLIMRMEKVCHCILLGEWPASRRYEMSGPANANTTPPVVTRNSVTMATAADIARQMSSSHHESGLSRQTSSAENTDSERCGYDDCTPRSDVDYPMDLMMDNLSSDARDENSFDGGVMASPSGYLPKKRKRRKRVEILAERAAMLAKHGLLNTEVLSAEAMRKILADGLLRADSSGQNSNNTRPNTSTAHSNSTLPRPDDKDIVGRDELKSSSNSREHSRRNECDASSNTPSDSRSGRPPRKRGRPRKVVNITDTMGSHHHHQSVHNPDQPLDLSKSSSSHNDSTASCHSHQRDSPSACSTDDEIMRRHRRKRKHFDPLKLDPDNLTGEERVIVIERETGKVLVGRSAPPLKDIVEWLEENTGYDIAPEWAAIVKEKISIPEELKIRFAARGLTKPCEDSKHHNESRLIPTMMTDPTCLMNNLHAAASLLPYQNVPIALPFPFPTATQGFPMGLPMAGINLASMAALTNPLLNLGAIGLDPSSLNNELDSRSAGGNDRDDSSGGNLPHQEGIALPLGANLGFPFLLQQTAQGVMMPQMFTPQQLAGFSMANSALSSGIFPSSALLGGAGLIPRHLLAAALSGQAQAKLQNPTPTDPASVTTADTSLNKDDEDEEGEGEVRETTPHDESKNEIDLEETDPPAEDVDGAVDPEDDTTADVANSPPADPEDTS